MAAIISRVSGEQTVTGRLALAVGTFSDPNFYALALFTGLPFLLLGATIENPAQKLISLVAILPILVTAVATGSRSGFLALITMLVVYFFRSSGRMRVYLLAGGGAVVMLVSAVASDYMVARLTTLFSSSYDESLSEQENRALAGATVGSARARQHLFWRSIELTIKNPIVGVGPGMFAVGEAEDAQEQNMEEVWHETHNAYTQVSSEIGIPGAIFYAAGIIIAFRSLSRVINFRAPGADNPDLYILRQTAMHMQLAMIVMLAGAMFLSIAYVGPLYLLFGLAVALDRSATKELSANRTAPVSATKPPGAIRTSDSTAGEGTSLS